MQFVPHAPQGQLQKYVESIFHFKHFQPEHSIERVVPDGRIYLIFELDGYERHVFDNESLEPIKNFTRVWLSGMHKNYMSISAHEDSEMFVIQFKPAGLAPFYQNAISDLNDSVIPAQTLFGEDVLTMHQNLKNATSDEKMFEIAERFLMTRANFKEDAGTVLIDNMLEAIQKNSTSQLQDIIEGAGYSQKQAIQLFKQRVGLNPKSFQRIIRFNEILPLVMEKKSVSWQHICAECAYYDQSHFIREFKAFCGYSPGDFLTVQADHPEPNFFPLD